MASQIQLTRSGTPGAQPTATEMELGELALNYADGKLYFKNDSNNIEQLNSTYNNSGQTIYVNDIDDYVGLNTTSPNFLLDLGGTPGHADNTLRINQNDGGSAIRIGGSANGDITLLRVDNADGETDSGAEGFAIKYLGTNPNNELGIFADNGSSELQALTILQNGNIGINVTNPSHQLEVLNHIKVVSSGGGTDSVIIDGASGSIELFRDPSTALAGNGPFIDFKNSSGDDYDTRIQQTNDANPGLQFSTGGNGSVQARFTILGDGNVGIGTSAPSEKLDVIGNIKASGFVSATIVHGPESADALTLRADPESPDMESGAGGDFGAGGAQISLHSSDSSVPNQIYIKSNFTYFQNHADTIVASIDPNGVVTADTDLTTKAYVDNTYQPGSVVETFGGRCGLVPARSFTTLSGTYSMPLLGNSTGDITPRYVTNNGELFGVLNYLRTASVKYIRYEFIYTANARDGHHIWSQTPSIDTRAPNDFWLENSDISVINPTGFITLDVDQQNLSMNSGTNSMVYTHTYTIECVDTEAEENESLGRIYWPVGSTHQLGTRFRNEHSTDNEVELFGNHYNRGETSTRFNPPSLYITATAG